MPFSEDEYVFLEDASGKRYGFRMSFGMLKIPSLGAIDGARFRDAEDGDTVSIMGKEFTIFRPGAMDMMLSLERGAQIITPKDAETIIMHCDVRCGRSVLEVGAGSGGLTTALLHAVAPEGRVHTLELKEENAQRAKRNVSRTGHDRYWSYTIGDAREAKPDIDWKADVLTMDMPDPWLAFPNLDPYLRSGGRICVYVPNANQVFDSVNALRDMGYADIHSLENIQRGMDVHPGGVRPSFDTLGHTGYLVFGRKRSGRVL
jgi:tRNA (adenine57-N1/adenine58-N1)-methyltransferase